MRKRNKNQKGMRLIGLLLAVAGVVLVVQLIPLHIWYVVLTALMILVLALAVLLRRK